MEIILREDIENLGVRGAVVKVASGYARNFLLPKKLAVPATDSNRKIVEQEGLVPLAAQIGGAAVDAQHLLGDPRRLVAGEPWRHRFEDGAHAAP